MPDTVTTIAELQDAVRRFAAERQWERFHTPKNLAMGLAVETAELMEHFLWLDGEESRHAADDPAKRQAIGEELADVANYVLNLSLVLGIDLSDAIVAKIAKNALKYPAEQYRGRWTT
ncbi:MAG: nucleotide pyrophosphohydrolase [Planctomycetia bacterium]|nr:nucleotide pyrophosphohydrolase [Planctomycetia bacterium]